MRHGILLTLAISGVLCTAFASPDRPNEPPGSEFLSENAFGAKPANNHQAAGTWWDIYPTGNAQIISDASAPKSPSGVLQQTRPPNSTGGTVIGYSFPRPLNEVYAAFWWKPSDPFYGWDNGTQKIASIQPSMNMFLIWAGQRTGGRSLKVLLQFSPNDDIKVDNSHYSECAYPFSSCLFNPNLGSGAVSGGQWHLIEWYVKLSTSTTSKDGILRWWVDGQIAGNLTHVNMKPFPYTDFQFNHTWDAGDPKQPTTDYHWFDHAYISAPNGAPPILMILGAPASGRTGIPYTTTLTADGGKSPSTWLLESGKLPSGLSLSASGVISGTPLCPGRSDFTIRVTDGSVPALTATKSFSMVVSGSGTCTSGMEDSREWRVASRESPFDFAQGTRELESQKIRVESRAGNVRFSLPVTGSAQYRLCVYDLAGKKVYAHESMGQKEISIVRTLKNGIYLAAFTQGKQSSSVRFNVMN